jgi:hypothetical protein
MLFRIFPVAPAATKPQKVKRLPAIAICNQYRLRSSMVESSYQAFQAAGVRPPETVTLLGPTPAEDPLTQPTQLSLL